LRSRTFLDERRPALLLDGQTDRIGFAATQNAELDLVEAENGGALSGR
jgi:hypothetical protein